MTFIDSIKTCFNKYALFEGTASRSEYWWFYLFTVLAPFILRAFSDILSGLLSLAILLPSIAAGARRLHDTDRSGWWQLLWFVPLVGWIVLIIFLAQESRANRYARPADVYA
jgi:uncharacterized membrane protein YhaH (DUF805 family)